MVNYLEQDEVVLVHDLLAQHHGEELVVGDVLDEGGNNVSRLLKPIIIKLKSVFNPCQTWKIVSSSQCGLIFPSSEAILLCSLTKRVWTIASTVCSLTRGSPAKKQ